MRGGGALTRGANEGPGPPRHLEGLGDAGFGGFVDLRLPDAAAAGLAQMAEAEAQILLVGVFLDLREGINQRGSLMSGVINEGDRWQPAPHLPEAHPVGLLADLRQPQPLLHLPVPTERGRRRAR